MIHHKHRRNISVLICISAVLCLLIGCAAIGSEPITSLEQLGEPGRKIGVPEDMLEFDLLQRDYPEAEVVPYTDKPLAYQDLANGRIDAFVYARREMEFAIANGTDGVRILDENYRKNTVAVGISPKAGIPDLQSRINAFLAESKADGTLDDMYLRWVVQADDTMPDIAMPENPALHLRVGTTGDVMPYSYYVGTELCGYDIELAYRFAAWLGADVEFKIYGFGGIISAAASGDIDCIMSNLFVTPENSEEIPFSDPLFDVEITAMVRDVGAVQKSSNGEVHWQDYNGKKLGVLVGPLMEDAAKQFFPDSEYLLLDSYPDCVTALLSGKIDGFLGDEPGMKSLHAEQPAVDYIHESLTENNYSFAFRKNDPESAALCEELNTFLAKCWSDGTMEELDVWFGTDEAKKTVDMSDLTGENGTIRVVTTSTDMPWSYIKDGKNVGYDIDLVVRFCRDRGYALEIGDVDFAGRIPAIQSGKYDFTTDMNVTPERMEQVLFSDPTSHGGIVLAVRASDLAAAKDPSGVTALDMEHATIAVYTGSTFPDILAEYLPEAKVEYFTTTADELAALKSRKIDAIALDEPIARSVAATDGAVTLYPKTYGAFDFAYIFAKNEHGAALESEVSAYIRALKSDGTLTALQEKWFDATDFSAIESPDYRELPDVNGSLHMVAGQYQPFVLTANGRHTGYEIEILTMFCRDHGYALEVTDVNSDAILPAVQTGKADIGGGCITVTEERKESLYFSEPDYSGGVSLVVLKQANHNDSLQSVDELAGKRIGVMTGSVHDGLVLKRLPDAQIVYFAELSDLPVALEAGKIDAFTCPESTAMLMQKEHEGMIWLDEHLADAPLGFAFAKTDEGRALNQRFSAFILAAKEDGTLDALREKWFESDESARTMEDYDQLPATNGTLTLATAGTQVPFTYMKDNRIVGYEIELAVRFCTENGYHLRVEQMNFDGLIASVQTGKCDFACSCLAMTEERKESIDFSESHYKESVVFAVPKSKPAETGAGFFASIGESFEKTFIRENRWQLFLQGIGTTMLITVLSIVFGTLLGFAVFMLCRNGNPVANTVTRFCVWLVQGMPVIVLLMILYYVIFGKVNISGAAVSVVGFTLVFGSGVFAMLRAGVGAIDRGQLEAAYALGYTNRKAFFRIILPQALPHFMPAYKGEITALIKATAVVGYVAVQDLTKMGDIVRSRTYEAFFPLIAVAIIYFILAAILTFLVNKIEIRIDPRRRSKQQILKGVKTDD